MTSPRSTGAPSSSHRAGRAAPARPSRRAEPGEIAVGVVIGRTSEFFDFFVYAIASVMVFPKLVFPYVDALTGTLYSFAIFALAFVARPFGTVIFMAIDRAYGRGAKLTSRCSCSAARPWPSPSCRATQTSVSASVVAAGAASHRPGPGARRHLGRPGVAAGAERAAEAPRLVRDDSAARRAARLHRGERAVRLLPRQPVAGGLPGLGLALSVLRRVRDQRRGAVRAAAHGRDAGVRAALRDARAGAAPIVRHVRVTGRNIVIGAFAPLASFALFHIVTVFPLSWVFLFTRTRPARFLIIQTVGAGVRRGGDRRFRLDRRPHRPPHGARDHRRR